MPLVMRFVVSVVFTMGVASAVSIGWPRFTAHPRPVPLEYVYHRVKHTPLAGQLAQTLGVHLDGATEPIQFASVAGQVAGATRSTVEERARSFVAQTALKQLANQIDHLPPDQRAQLEAYICPNPDVIEIHE